MGHRHPDHGQLDTHAQLAWLDRGLEALAGTGSTRATRPRSCSLLNGYVFWAARLRQPIPTDAVEAVVPPSLDLSNYPSLAAMMASGIFDDQTTAEEEWAFGLDLTPRRGGRADRAPPRR